MVFVIIILVVIFLFFLILCGKELVGEWLMGVFPIDRLKNGDKVDVFLNGKHNRTATISGITSDSILIYDKLPLPVDYRGRFYATGVDQSDGSKLVYLNNRKYFKFVRAAELVKRLFNVLDDVGNLIPDEPIVVEDANGNIETESETEEEGNCNDL